jgi:hypothetical protein
MNASKEIMLEMSFLLATSKPLQTFLFKQKQNEKKLFVKSGLLLSRKKMK